MGLQRWAPRHFARTPRGLAAHHHGHSCRRQDRRRRRVRCRPDRRHGCPVDHGNRASRPRCSADILAGCRVRAPGTPGLGRLHRVGAHRAANRAPPASRTGRPHETTEPLPGQLALGSRLGSRLRTMDAALVAPAQLGRERITRAAAHRRSPRHRRAPSPGRGPGSPPRHRRWAAPCAPGRSSGSAGGVPPHRPGSRSGCRR